MKSIDPARMSPIERLAELGEVLAAGTQRFLARKIKPVPAQNEPENQREQLDAVGAVEAECPARIGVPA